MCMEMTTSKAKYDASSSVTLAAVSHTTLPLRVLRNGMQWITTSEAPNLASRSRRFIHGILGMWNGERAIRVVFASLSLCATDRLLLEALTIRCARIV